MDKLWSDEKGNFTLRALTNADVVVAENRLNVKLPPAYVNMVLEQNGGMIVRNAFPAPDHPNFTEPFVEVDYIYGIGSNTGLFDSAYFQQEWGLPDGLLLFNGDGHAWLAFDYRKVAVDPPIVYVDNHDDTKIIKLANDFDSFINQLYTEETVDEEVEFYEEEWTKDEFEALMAQQNKEELMQAILFFAQSDVDVKWFGEKLLQLSYDSRAIVRRAVAECIWNNMTHQFTEEQNQAFIEQFKKDQDPDVRMNAELIAEKITYSYEMLQEEIKQNVGGVYLTFCLDGEYYHLYHEEKWCLELDEDIQMFDTSTDLLEKARVKALSLKEVWPRVKIV